MQQEKSRRSNVQRTEATRTALLAAARDLFVSKGYAATGTPEIADRAEVTRGALYHHFADKADLLRALVEREARAVAEAIAADARGASTALEALTSGSDAYFAAMEVEGRAKLLLVEGPAVLGGDEMDRIDKESGADELLKGLQMAAEDGQLKRVPLRPLAVILSAAFDKAAMMIADGAKPEPYRQAARTLLAALVTKR
jgi:AcrR family transcriptional regulator